MSTIAVQAALAARIAERAPKLLEIPEDQWYERKSGRIKARALADDIVAFANAEGGTIVIGLYEGRVEGVRSWRGKVNEWRQAAIDFTNPPVRVVVRSVPCLREDASEDDLLVVEVPASEHVHATVGDDVFLRVGDETKRLTFLQRQELLYDKGQAAFETRPVGGATIDDLDDGLVASYANALGQTDHLRLLVARGLVRGPTEVSAACFLLFGRNPGAEFPEAYVRVLRYRGTERGTGARQRLIEERRCEGPLPVQLLKAREAVADLQPTRRALLPDGRFGPRPVVPGDAWLEGIVNAVVHRSYSLGGDHIRVDIFEDRLEIESPGRAPGLVDLADPLETTRFARNPRIARVCADLNFGQELGEGIRRMFAEMRLAGLTDPFYRQTSGSVVLTLSAEASDSALDDRMPPGYRAIVRLLRDAGRLGSGEFAEALNLSRPTTLRRLKALQEAGVIEWVGRSPKDPRAYWQLRAE